MTTTSATITVRYSSIDRFSQTRRFKTVEGARRYAQKWLGPYAEVAYSGYAVSGDGIGKVTVTGASLFDLFPSQRADAS